MQNTASVPVDQFSDLLNRLPAGLDLDTLAGETKAIQRDRKIGGGANLLRLALARGPSGFSLRQSSGWVSLLEIAELSSPGVHYRLKQAVGFLAALIVRLLMAKAPGARLRWPGRTLRLSDRSGLAPRGDQEGEETRSAQSDRGRVHDRGDVAAGERVQGERHPGRLPLALADRTRIQTPEIAAAYGYAADPHRTDVAKLALRAPHRGAFIR